MKLYKFVVLIVVLMMLAGLTIYVVLDSELVSGSTSSTTVTQTTANEVQNVNS